jgi:hypothetical protein
VGSARAGQIASDIKSICHQTYILVNVYSGQDARLGTPQYPGRPQTFWLPDQK